MPVICCAVDLSSDATRCTGSKTPPIPKAL